jgi:hypothetical protein
VTRARRTPHPLLLLAACWMYAAPGAARAQDAPAPLEPFVEQVARLWLSAEVGALVELLPADNRLLLDTGSGIEPANSRHAAAALRALFAERETIAARPARVTVASAQPPRGFFELAWTFRARGAPGEQSRSVYVAVLWEERGWRISELRLMP